MLKPPPHLRKGTRMNYMGTICRLAVFNHRSRCGTESDRYHDTGIGGAQLAHLLEAISTASRRLNSGRSNRRVSGLNKFWLNYR